MKVNDKRWRELKAKLEAMGHQNSYVKVGVIDGGMHSSGFSLAELLAVHEFGSKDGRIPAREPLASTFRESKDGLVKMLGQIAKGVVADTLTPEQGLDRLGLWGATEVKRRISSGKIEPGNAASTIARKGSSKPLVDTGQLVNAITWQVVK